MDLDDEFIGHLSWPSSSILTRPGSLSFFERDSDQVTPAKCNERGPWAVDCDVRHSNPVAQGPPWSPFRLLTERAPGLLKALREADYVLLDDTVAGCGRADYSHKYRWHGVNVRVVTDPDGRLLRLSPALPGRIRDLTAVRTHRIPPWRISFTRATHPG